jgi:hypothetical protein
MVLILSPLLLPQSAWDDIAPVGSLAGAFLFGVFPVFPLRLSGEHEIKETRQVIKFALFLVSPLGIEPRTY